jgi:hypothetical protein
MIATAREVLKRNLSSKGYQRACLSWWYSKFYLPRRVASIVVRQAPVVHGQPSAFVDQLRGINLYAPTPMCVTMTKYGSDKGNSWHNYTAVYFELFGKLRNRPLRIFELGLGTNNPNLASTMGVDGRPGASLRGWRELFPKSLVFGADIDRDILFTDDRIMTFYCDQTDSKAIAELWAQPPMREQMDILIDDGLHRFSGNASFLEGSLGHLRPGGTYVIEDIRNEEVPIWLEHLPGYASQYPICDFALLELPSHFNNYDNNMLVIRKRS